ncbi:MAG TPA: ferritin-like domain-containing protein [Planctomycetaceae bacterium]|jgi:uncharacterized ferritin-like protein (DUF455 family)|nr:ferritin-like domain-containing protein [Planctomycetaceae bacterium]
MSAGDVPHSPSAQIRDVAERILLSETLTDKLAKIPAGLSDDRPGALLRVSIPGRPVDLKFAPRRTAPTMPRPGALCDPQKRAIAHHILANHELQALEVMAFVLLAFPDAPSEFRRGLVSIMRDEQRHTNLHVRRAAELGLRFGELPVNDYIWAKAQAFESVLDYLAGLPLTFEGRNLDHTLEFEAAFERAGDLQSAAILRAIHRDEIGHVRFGLEWLRRLKPAEQSDWDAYCAHLHWPLRAEKAIGDTLHRDPRLEAGMTEEFIERLAAAQRESQPPARRNP